MKTHKKVSLRILVVNHETFLQFSNTVGKEGSNTCAKLQTLESLATLWMLWQRKRSLKINLKNMAFSLRSAVTLQHQKSGSVFVLEFSARSNIICCCCCQVNVFKGILTSFDRSSKISWSFQKCLIWPSLKIMTQDILCVNCFSLKSTKKSWKWIAKEKSSIRLNFSHFSLSMNSMNCQFNQWSAKSINENNFKKFSFELQKLMQLI